MCFWVNVTDNGRESHNTFKPAFVIIINKNGNGNTATTN